MELFAFKEMLQVIAEMDRFFTGLIFGNLMKSTGLPENNYCSYLFL